MSSLNLAVRGGQPLRGEPFAPWPYFDEEIVETVSEVLRSGKVNYWSGQQGRKFEEEFAVAVGTKYAVVVANGTLSLELALAGFGIGPGDGAGDRNIERHAVISPGAVKIDDHFLAFLGQFQSSR